LNNPILVTGGAGFIGSHVIEGLVEAGHQVVCVDNFDSYYSTKRKRNNIRRALESGRVELIESDIRFSKTLREVFRQVKPASIVHLAARAGVRPSLANPRVYLENNVRGTLNVLEAARQVGVERVVAASSSSVYGPIEGMAKENETPCRPLSPYGASKVAAEALCSSYSHTAGMDIVALRFFTVFGPRQRPDMAIAKFTRNISNGIPITVHGDGSSLRDYTFVSDATYAIEAALLADLHGYHVFNIGRADPVRLSDLISLIEAQLGRSAERQTVPEQPGDPQLTFADISLASQMLNYQPRVNIDDGVAQYITWFKAQLSD
jgi:UDP-glucuronate 4-epimerase